MEYLLYFVSYIISKLINKADNGLDVKNILIIKLDHLGDVVTSLPSVYAIRNKFPNAEITFLSGEWAQDVLKNNPYIDNVIIYNSKKFNRAGKNKYSLIERIKYLKNIFKKRYDLIEGYRDDWLTLIFSLVYLPKSRIDRGTARIRLKFSGKNIHEVDTNLMLAGMAGAKVTKENKCIFLTEDEMKWAEDFLNSKRLKDKGFVIINPGAKWKYRRWDTRKFALLADNIKSKFALEILIAGSDDEIETAEEMQKTMNEENFSIAGKTNIRQILSLLEKAALCITNDSGMVHLASGLNVPIAAIFGPTDPKRFGPWSDDNIFFNKKVDCFPCGQKKCKQKNNPCIDQIEVDDVFEKILLLLKNKVSFPS